MMGLAVRALAAVPILGALWLLLTVATEPSPTIGVTVLLLAYLVAWQRIETGGGLPGALLVRLAVPTALAVAALLLAVAIAALAAVDEPGLALVIAVAGMAAAIGAVALAVRPALRR